MTKRGKRKAKASSEKEEDLTNNSLPSFAAKRSTPPRKAKKSKSDAILVSPNENQLENSQKSNSKSKSRRGSRSLSFNSSEMSNSRSSSSFKSNGEGSSTIQSTNEIPFAKWPKEEQEEAMKLVSGMIQQGFTSDELIRRGVAKQVVEQCLMEMQSTNKESTSSSNSEFVSKSNERASRFDQLKLEIRQHQEKLFQFEQRLEECREERKQDIQSKSTQLLLQLKMDIQKEKSIISKLEIEFEEERKILEMINSTENERERLLKQQQKEQLQQINSNGFNEADAQREIDELFDSIQPEKSDDKEKESIQYVLETGTQTCNELKKLSNQEIGIQTEEIEQSSSIQKDISELMVDSINSNETFDLRKAALMSIKNSKQFNLPKRNHYRDPDAPMKDSMKELQESISLSYGEDDDGEGEVEEDEIKEGEEELKNYQQRNIPLRYVDEMYHFDIDAPLGQVDYSKPLPSLKSVESIKLKKFPLINQSRVVVDLNDSDEDGDDDDGEDNDDDEEINDNQKDENSNVEIKDLINLKNRKSFMKSTILSFKKDFEKIRNNESFNFTISNRNSSPNLISATTSSSSSTSIQQDGIDLELKVKEKLREIEILKSQMEILKRNKNQEGVKNSIENFTISSTSSST